MIGQSTKLIERFSVKKRTHRKSQQMNKSESIRLPNSFVHPPSSSIPIGSEMSSSIFNKSFTFASVFDEYESNVHSNSTLENGDLIVVIPNKTICENVNPEPYPFRSEIPCYSLSKSSSTGHLSSTTFLRKKSFRHPKKLHHPIPTIENSINRSKSSSDFVSQQQHSSKTVRQWLKSSSVGRIIHTFLKHPTPVYTKEIKQKSSMNLSKYPDIIY